HTRFSRDWSSDVCSSDLGTEVLVVGHTDSTGSDQYNQGLSERRASSARAFLVGAGLEPSRVRAVGRGESEPIAENESEAGRQLKDRKSVVQGKRVGAGCS